MSWTLQMGALRQEDGSVAFSVWAPEKRSISLHTEGKIYPMEKNGEFFQKVLPKAEKYTYIIDDEIERPDPASRFQPHGVHGPSKVCDPHAFSWTDHEWHGLQLGECVIYEAHVGLCTPQGTFTALIDKLPHLKETGINALELMPIVEFPGLCNWGYDGTYSYAPCYRYGRPDELKQLINECHNQGIALILDVVYNHLGPEGNYLADFAPYFTDKYQSSWGDAINFDGPHSDYVRRYFIDNALYWLHEFHVDGLRLDAIHGIYDFSPKHILAELSEEFHDHADKLGKQAWLIAESDLNDIKVIESPKVGGYGIDAQWSDDFHHSLHVLLTDREHSYLIDFGYITDLTKAVSEGFVYDGRRSQFRKKAHGTSSTEYPGNQFVIFTQNHDQIANTSFGNRLSSFVSAEELKVAASLLLTAPNIPLIFMGQEWGAKSPFYYFTGYQDHKLANTITEEYRAENRWNDTHPFIDPQDPRTYEMCKIRWEELKEPHHAQIMRLYRDLIRCRKAHAPLYNCDKKRMRINCDPDHEWVTILRGDQSGKKTLFAFNLAKKERRIPIDYDLDQAELLIHTRDIAYGGDTIKEELEAATYQDGRIILPSATAVLYLIT